MTTQTAEQIADDAMRDHKGDDVSPGEWWRGSTEEMRSVIIAAIEADRAQRGKYVLSFEPDAIRDHFEADEDDPTEGMTDKELLAVGMSALQDDRLYEVFHELLAEGVGA